MVKYKRNPYLDQTINLTSGIVGLGAASGAAATLPAGLTRTITTSGTLPIAGLGLMSYAGTPPSQGGRRARHKRHKRR
jgi:hypothetical protein